MTLEAWLTGKQERSPRDTGYGTGSPMNTSTTTAIAALGSIAVGGAAALASIGTAPANERVSRELTVAGAGVGIGTLAAASWAAAVASPSFLPMKSPHAPAALMGIATGAAFVGVGAFLAAGLSE